MALQCNIDAKGKAIRLIYGAVCSVVGVLLIFLWAKPAGGWFAWTVTLLLLIGGAFMIFESRSGWCVIRAMGFKTRV
jgi:hypothetical protein